MKKLLLALSFIVIALTTKAQKIKFTDTTNYWTGYNWSDAISPPIADIYHYFYGTDTVMSGLGYRKMYNAVTTDPVAFIREDSVSKRVYAICSAFNPIDTTEQLLTDYSLHTGDTLRCRHTTSLVGSVDSVMINSTWHKVLYFTTISTDSIFHELFMDYYVIEGIGCASAPLFPLHPFTFEVASNLTCFNNRGITPPLSHLVGPYFNNTTSCTLTFGAFTKLVSVNHNNVKVSPNPIDESSRIILPYAIQSGTLLLINGMGQVVVNTAFNDLDEIPIGNRVQLPGIYFYRVTNNLSGERFFGKFVY